MEQPSAASRWPSTVEELLEQQVALALAADAVLGTEPWRLPSSGRAPLVGGCFATFARADPPAGAWAAAVAWRPPLGVSGAGPWARHGDQMLVGTGPGGPRRARDLEDQVVVRGATCQGYLPGLLALREGALLAAAVDALRVRPEVLLLDATGRDHPRRAGLALQLGAVVGLPTVGVTHRPLVAEGQPVPGERGTTSPLLLDGAEVARWVCTRSGARPVLAHAGWRTDPATAAAVVLAASTEGARTPVPLAEARRAAREARAIGEGRQLGWPR